MKTHFFFYLFILFFISFTACLGTNVKNESLIPPSINNDSKDNYSSSRISEVNFSSIQNLGSGSIHTNASFVAQIALLDKNVQEMLRHGSTIHGIIDFMPSRPKGWNMSVGPTLWIDHRDIDIYFYINETGRFVERYEIVVPGYLYRKERSNNNTCLLDINGTAVLAFNASEIWFPKENTCS